MYVQVSDRHNGNILLDTDGHIIHVDFGFILGDAPGGGLFSTPFETAPFKLTAEYIDLLGGVQSVEFRLFEDLLARGLSALQRHEESIAALAEVLLLVLLVHITDVI
jgi:phosphatidylinositol kinase/protein kinase (PI-3  family)